MIERFTQGLEGGRHRRPPSRRVWAAAVAVVLAAVVGGCGDGKERAVASGDSGIVIEDRNGRPVERAGAGAELQIRYPAAAGELAEWTRGIVVGLDRADGDEWRGTHRLFVGRADPPRPPAWSPIDEDGDVEMIGLQGEGPDQIVLPPGLSPGSVRLCTVFRKGPDAARRLCAVLQIEG